ncbi:hypothetical protein [Kitasatospora mediocidica]|uniref:hypothetical protein n=1 Tax=Kitasatospora mediocidica TaxID=58352 RepID=UPI0005658DCE|nr:hypothetical protein [Kitasatospora mediocidica]
MSQLSVPVRKALLAGCAALLLAGTPTAAAAAPATPAALVVVPMNPEPAPAGGRTVVHAFVANEGGSTAQNPFTVTVTLPREVSAATPFFPASCKPLPAGRTVSCTFAGGLGSGRTATALIPVVIPAGTPSGKLSGGRVAVAGPDASPDPARSSAAFTITVG